MTGKKASARWMLDRPAELIDLDKVDEPWWRRAGVGTLNYSLVQDGKEVAVISTSWEDAPMHLPEGVRKWRRTVVKFKSGGEWAINPHIPGPRSVEVMDGGEQIAYMAVPGGFHIGSTGTIEVKTADGQSVTLNPQPLKWHGVGDVATGEALTITKAANGNYLLTFTSSIPLEAVLLHWHFLLGDRER